MNNVNMFEKKILGYYSNVNDLINYIKENEVMSFILMENETQDKVNTIVVSTLNMRAKEQNVKLVYFDNEHQCFSDDFDNIYLTNDFYNKYKIEIKKALEDNIINSEYTYVSKEMYSDDLARKICLTAKRITFYDVDLPDDITKLCKERRINVYVNKNGNEKQISSSRILGIEYSSVISDSELIILKPDIDDYENLKYIPKNKKIKIYDCNKNNYDNVLKILKTLNDNNQSNEITLKVDNRLDFVKHDLFKNNNYDYKIEINNHLEEYEHQEMIEEEKIFDIIISDINRKNYSPYEKYLACYNITKKFKKYKENPDDLSASRRLNHLMNNEYMVCVGYARMLQELLNRVGINSYDYSTGTDISYDAGFTEEEKTLDMNGHARLIVNINDPKYGINGIYVADPTWDNDLENDYYNHALMTFDKTAQEKRYMQLTDEDLLLNVKSMGDFNERVNFYIKQKVRSNFNFGKTDEEKLFRAYGMVINDCFKIIKELLPEYYSNIFEKYNDLRHVLWYNASSNNKVSEFFDHSNEFLTEVAHIFINHLGKDVKIDVTIDAAVKINKEVFGLDDEQEEKYHEELLSSNLKKDEKSFPYYYEDNKSKTK